MTPITKNICYYFIENKVDMSSPDAIESFSNEALGDYKNTYIITQILIY